MVGVYFLLHGSTHGRALALSGVKNQIPTLNPSYEEKEQEMTQLRTGTANAQTHLVGHQSYASDWLRNRAF